MKKKVRIKKKPIFLMLIVLIALVGGFMYFKQPVKKNNSNVKVSSKKAKRDKKVEAKQSKKVSLVMVGDVLIHEAVYKDALKSDGTYSFDGMFEEVKSILKDYDLRYCNQESIIGGKDLGISGYPNFNSPDEIGDTITSLGFNLIGLANNHAFDKGEKAIVYSNKYWNSKGINKAGSYLSFEERNNIPVLEKNGLKYAFLAYTTGINGNQLPSGKEYLINLYDKDTVKKDIDSIRDKVDVVIVAMHWGDEYTNTPTNSQKRIAEELSSMGVDLIIGTHPHVVQPVEYIDDTLVIYSLGNFISNQLVIGENPAIGLLLGLDISLDNNKVKFDIKRRELVYSYSNNSTNFKVIPFSKMTEAILKNYKSVEKKYLEIIGDVS